jgi:cytoskeletal protein CcmA (bactofilin family)
VIISPTGCFIGDLSGLSGAYIDGKVIGDVNVENLHLGSSAAVHGDITCKSLQIDGGAALVGRLEISPNAPINSDYDESKSIIEGDVEEETHEFPLESPQKDALEAEEEFEEHQPSPVKPPPRRQYRVVLFIMEPQVDFYPGGKCGAKGSRDDAEAAERLADFIHAHMDDIDDIVITLDSHNVRLLALCTMLCAESD